MRWSLALLSWLVLSALAGSLAAAQAPDTTPGDSALREDVEVRLAQVAISVTDPKNPSFRSVPGLTLDQFVIRLDGRDLTPAERAKVFFDEICAPRADAEAAPGAPASPRGAEAAVNRIVLAIVDLNYVLPPGRERVAKAIEALAERALDDGLLVKVYVLTRQVRQLTPGLTNDAATLREAAAEIRRTIYVRQSDGADAEAIPSTQGRAPKSVDAGGGGRGGPALPSVAPDDLDRPGARSATPMSTAEMLGLPLSPLDNGGAAAAESAWFVEGNRLMHDYDPGASLAAIEGIMRAHAHYAGRKAVVLFTAESFRFVDVQKVDQETAAIKETARLGFSLWTVDTAGLGREQPGASELMSLLASDTGGGSVRLTNDLSLAFRHAADQLSCYYLVSLPVAAAPRQSVRRSLSVRLDTDRFRELWGLRVAAPTLVTVPDRPGLLRARRVAALLAPDDFDRPQVSATLAYPSITKGQGDEERAVLFSRFRVPLDTLAWETHGGGVEAQVLVDAVVQRESGSGLDTVCEIGAEKTGRLTLRLPAPPPRGAGALVIELPCAWRRDGMYSARGVVTDLVAESVGAARSTAIIREGGTRTWAAYGARVEAASGRDLVWRPGADAAVRDVKRRATRALGGSPARPADRIVLRYVLCGPDASAAPASVAHALLRLDGTTTTTRLSFPADALAVAGPGTGRFCAPASLTVPEFTLEPGSYAFVAHAADGPSGARRELARAIFSVAAR